MSLRTPCEGFVTPAISMVMKQLRNSCTFLHLRLNTRNHQHRPRNQVQRQVNGAAALVSSTRYACPNWRFITA